MATFVELHYTPSDPGVRINFDLVKTYKPIDRGGTEIVYINQTIENVIEPVKTIDNKLQQARTLDVYNYPS